mmetsp:Transcript_18257/g.30446  ORF Transcript_18257/g.30446 Transcript_18257/m.30446 type:complete len:162 (-) Transcript_18257:235-720(-)|eukprot:CAMPEP_0114431138 /NCGR_PEP_ID=MMETSP0103-20121206/10433_1 /TAXON_ID=37642 ORGANISM="Paraphysomonas imperforata, Strain PA2" /NCGR_SAMPLE_ID=MMETSP0103 /ASSEMBLY_ACC=CAM_ASM_000201 /LENGTH=161 /DNA_ID=CAMNT_0001600669 /DNA_START=32 /DNA_END=517 /DNA_ORIENTATION=-
MLRAMCTVGPNGKSCDGSSGDTGVSGVVQFEQDGDGPVTISYRVTGLTEGLHGFHIHEFADFSNGCVSAGPHWNPHGCSHGGPEDQERHAGDLGNITANADGVAEGVISDSLVRLAGEFTVLGRSVMVHADPDDLGRGGHELSATTGNAGGRIACGEIVAV